MEPVNRLDDAARDKVLESLVQQNPDAWIMAVLPTGIYTSMPASYTPMSDGLVEGPVSALHLAVPDDRVAVIEAWERARRAGAAQTQIRIGSAPDRPAVLYIVDATHRHGVYFEILSGHPGPDRRPGSTDMPLLPRVATVRKDQVAVFIATDEATTRILGWSTEELVGRRALEFVHPDDHERAIAQWLDMLAHPGSLRRARLRHRRRDGSWVWLEVTNRNCLADPEHGDVLTEMVDITDEMEALEALRASEQLLRRLTEALPVGVLHVDAQRYIRYRNTRLTSIIGAPSATTVDGQFAGVVEQDRQALARAVTNALEAGHDADVEVEFRGHDETERCFMIGIRTLLASDGAVSGAVLCVTDVTEDVQLRAELEDRAAFDELTRCHNRASTLAALEQTLQTAQNGSGTAVVFIDLNQFKKVNDEIGHAAGDRLLQHVAEQLRTAARRDDVVGRLGGDEFLVVCRDVRSPREALGAAVRMAESVATQIDLGSGAFIPRAGYGVAWTPAGHDGADALVGRADAAMYESKRSGTGDPVLAPHHGLAHIHQQAA